MFTMDYKGYKARVNEIIWALLGVDVDDLPDVYDLYHAYQEGISPDVAASRFANKAKKAMGF